MVKPEQIALLRKFYIVFSAIQETIRCPYRNLLPYQAELKL